MRVGSGAPDGATAFGRREAKALILAHIFLSTLGLCVWAFGHGGV